MSIAKRFSDAFGGTEPAANDTNNITANNTKNQTSIENKTVFTERGNAIQREEEDKVSWANHIRISGVVVQKYVNDKNMVYLTLLTRDGKNAKGEDHIQYPQIVFYPEVGTAADFNVKDFVTIDAFVRSYRSTVENRYIQVYVGSAIKNAEFIPDNNGNGRGSRRFENVAFVAGEVISVRDGKKFNKYIVKTVRNGRMCTCEIIDFARNALVTPHSFVRITGLVETGKRNGVDGETLYFSNIVARKIVVSDARDEIHA